MSKKEKTHGEGGYYFTWQCPFCKEIFLFSSERTLHFRVKLHTQKKHGLSKVQLNITYTGFRDDVNETKRIAILSEGSTKTPIAFVDKKKK